MYLKVIAFGRRFEAEYAPHPAKPAEPATPALERYPDDAPTPMRTGAGFTQPRPRFRHGVVVETKENPDA